MRFRKNQKSISLCLYMNKIIIKNVRVNLAKRELNKVDVQLFFISLKIYIYMCIYIYTYYMYLPVATTRLD